MKKNWLLGLALLIAGCAPAVTTPAASPPTDTPPVVGESGASAAPQDTATPSETLAKGEQEETAQEAVPEEREALGAEAVEHEKLLNQILLGSTSSNPEEILAGIRESKDTRFVAGLVDTLRYQRSLSLEIGDTLNELTGQDLPPDWFEWVEWAGQHPEIESFEDYPGWKANLFSQIDPNFLRFVHQDVKVDPGSRVEEIVWGGVRVDGIPALDNPQMIDPAEADYLVPDERVFGVSLNGDTRAYPARFLDWHEMFNDIVGGEPVSLAY